MLYHLLFPLREVISGFNVFRYISFRAGGAAVTALLFSFLIGPLVLRYLKNHRVVEEIRSDGPPTHLAKAGTPTMGGLMILPSLLIGTLLFARLDNIAIWMIVGATSWMGAVGFIDDRMKSHNGKEGLHPKLKLASQFLLGLVIGLLLYYHPSLVSPQFAEYKTLSTLPFFKNAYLNFAPLGIGVLFIAMVMLVIAGTSNAVNLTDGLDGLAIGVIGIMTAGLAAIAYITGHAGFSRYLNIVYLPNSGEIAVYCAALIGSSLGFLWFNAPPAKVYMGDTGALAIGAGLAVTAVLIKKELFLLMLGGIPVAEALSVMLQRYWFKYTRIRFGQGRRIFKMAPLHHHFELMGWPESLVVVRFWIIGVLLLFLTMTSFKVR